MKHLSRAFIAVILAMLMATLMPAQVFADTPDYISEVKVFEGDYSSAESEGYTLLLGDDNKPVDLNQGSGSTDMGAKGNKSVYLGFKTTKDKDEAITDLALMNMKGGYDVAEYDKLMDDQMSKQIVPFVDGFLAAINEYRENYKSNNSENKGRAQFIHEVLNKFTDDDCGGAGLGDLLLNETVYEMAKPKYDALTDEQKEKTTFYDVNKQVRDALSETEKNSHADILTIIAQSNGKLMLVMENLMTRAADTNDDTWLERFEDTTYDDLATVVGGTPKDAQKALAKMYDDKSQEILEKWDDFQEELLSYEENVEAVESFDEEQAEDRSEAALELDTKSDTDEAVEKIVDLAEQQVLNAEFINKAQSAVIHDILEGIDYLDGTMLDFFSMSREEIEDDITLLYPLAASLTEGQLAGLEFLSLKDMFAVALTTAEGYKEVDLSKIEACSVYEGVDRGIYQKGGVALTSDAFREEALAKMAQEQNDNSIFSTATIAMIAVTGICALGAFASFMTWATIKLDVYSLRQTINALSGSSGVPTHKAAILCKSHPGVVQQLKDVSKTADGTARANKLEYLFNDYADDYAAQMAPKSTIAGSLAIGLTVATIVIGAVTTYLAYRDMKAHYNVDFTPIPHYMVDAKNLIGYNSKGEKIVRKNQSAYYKAVQSNRKNGDSYFNEIDTCADMNGCVNPQWLALYAAKNEEESPILASSLKVVIGSSTVPNGYETGIHFFGEKAAFNLNNKLYCWNQKANSVMVYFKTDDSPASTTGSNFSAGTLALAGGGGLLLGVAVTALGMTASKKRKDNKAVTA